MRLRLPRFWSVFLSEKASSRRSSGLLLHITSLPSGWGIGDLGPAAYRFADFLSRAKQGLWQILALNPTMESRGYSPYDCVSAFAGNPMVISCELLAREGLLGRGEIAKKPFFEPGRVDFRRVGSYKRRLFGLAYERFRARRSRGDYERFCDENRYWLEEWAVYSALRNRFGSAAWSDWPREFRDRDKKAFASEGQIKGAVEKEKFLQYAFFRQWVGLKKYCNERGILLIGDIPFYVSYDSADVWTHREVFKLDKAGKSVSWAGVPPDYFSRAGQLWGNPIYAWGDLKKNNYRWWIERIRHELGLFDIVRIDHFRGFVAYWEVPAGAKTARSGRWVKGPKEGLFNVVLRHFPPAAIIVEDLGYITPDVREFVGRLGLAGMKVLQFAFDDKGLENPYLPHNHIENCVVYTGTHDNNTVRGWFEKEAKDEQKRELFEYVGRRVSCRNVHLEFVRMAMGSAARMAVIPVQDLLGLDSESRMNHPGRKRGNWRWQLRRGQLTGRLADRLAELTETHNRACEDTERRI